MQTHAGALVLLTCCLWLSVHAQNQDANQEGSEPERRKSVWEEPIQFLTKAKDQCSMAVTGQGDLTKLRITCQGQDRAYWCEYQGKPQVCRAYNNNPRHYFTQIMWDLRKLQHACQGQRQMKPLMCKRASDEAQMVFTASSSPDAVPRDKPEQKRPDQPRPKSGKPQPARPQPSKPQPARPAQTKPDQSRPEQGKPVSAKPGPKNTTLKKILIPKTPSPKPTKVAPKGEAKKIAQEYCWRSLQGVCAYVIGWFRN
ncbi:fibroblast growth factor binding protein 2a [Chanos chanos]|uniref:Fibroblast growth factor binding protein 2a n=1 Tax=Chanos chanos TaxID=29144 RepID=A0A6J2WMS9_CHACN|nr:fibroblast growth factor-binding protein 2-like [Chanos chanos]